MFKQLFHTNRNEKRQQYQIHVLGRNPELNVSLHVRRANAANYKTL